MKNVMSERIGSARTPTSMAWEIAGCRRSGLPLNGATKVKYPVRVVREASCPT